LGLKPLILIKGRPPRGAICVSNSLPILFSVAGSEAFIVAARRNFTTPLGVIYAAPILALAAMLLLANRGFGRGAV
jgi:hypothetical protein